MKIIDENSFAQIMATRRKELKIPLRSLSDSSGIPKSTLSMIERGEMGISLNNAIKIANALSIEMHL